MKQKLKDLCAPQTPEEVSENLKEILDLHAHEMGKPVDREIQALMAGIRLIKFLLRDES